jgi:hypothetical protein
MTKKDKVVRMLSNGGTVNEIIREVKCTPAYVYQVRAKYNKEKQVVKRTIRKDVKVKSIGINDMRKARHYLDKYIQLHLKVK